MLYLQRVSSFSYQILETNEQGQLRQVDHFNDDRGLSSRKLIQATNPEIESAQYQRQLMIKACTVMTIPGQFDPSFR